MSDATAGAGTGKLSAAAAAAERRKQRILGAGGDRLSKITGLQGQSHGTPGGGADLGSVSSPTNPAPSNTIPKRTLSPAKKSAAAPASVVASASGSGSPSTGTKPAPNQGAQIQRQTPSQPIQPPQMQQMQMDPSALEGMRNRFLEAMAAANIDNAASTVNQPPLPSVQSATTTTSPSQPAQQQQKPVQQQSSVALLIRLAVAGAMVALCFHFLTQFAAMEDMANAYYTDDEDSLASSTDPVFLGPFNMIPIASLVTQQIHVSIGIPLVGGLSISVWGLFVLVELMRQVVRFVSGAFDRAAPPALPGGAMVQMAVSMATLQMGGSGQQYVKVLGQLYGIYQSLVEDLSVFVVLLGVAVGFADLYVSYYGSSSSSNGV